jgi:large subunit ribosomal protein L18
MLEEKLEKQLWQLQELNMRKSDQRLKRKVRIRKKVYGDSNKPRLAVYKSSKNIYVQAIDDLNHTTIGSASTLSKELKVERLTIDAAKKVGELMGDILNKNKIEEAVFDRGGYIYHGRVKALADGIREKGIKF